MANVLSVRKLCKFFSITQFRGLLPSLGLKSISSPCQIDTLSSQLLSQYLSSTMLRALIKMQSEATLITGPTCRHISASLIYLERTNQLTTNPLPLKQHENKTPCSKTCLLKLFTLMNTPPELIHSAGTCRMRRFLAVLRSFYYSSLLCKFSCHPSPPTILPSSLTSSSHLFLGLPLNLVLPNSYILLFWEFYFLPLSVHTQTNIIYLTLLSLL